MSVPARYILAAIAFGIAALGFMLLPVDAYAQCNGCNRPPQPPACQQNCGAPPPCRSCQPPQIIVPPPYVPPPNIVVVNAGARASAQANATAIAVANVQTGDVIVRSNMVSDVSAETMSSAAAFAVSESSYSAEARMTERMLLIQAMCMDERGMPHPASQTFGGRDVSDAYAGEIFRCMSGTRMRYTMDGRSFDCAAGEALWYEANKAECRTQIARRPCNERSLLRRFGPGDKMVRIREVETHQMARETQFNASMMMDGGVGQSVY